MEGKKGSSFSLTTELFGSKESTQPSASTGIFASIFPPPSKILGRNSNSEVTGSWQKQHSGNQEWSNKKETPGIPTKDRSSIFQEERAEPCHLSSSLYYGGQDVYSQSSSTQSSASYPIFKKDGEEDVQNGSSASRGNWWQGSLYY